MKKTILKWGIPLVIGIGILAYQIDTSNRTFANNGSELAENAVPELDSSDIEYIKVMNKDGSYEEHWRDLQTLEERRDTYNHEETLINQIIVTNGGKTVITIGNEGGQLEGYTWDLPNNITQENKKILKNSLHKEIKEELKTSKWKFVEKTLLKDTTVNKIEAKESNIKQVVYIDKQTGFPIKKDNMKLKTEKRSLLKRK